MTSRFLPLLLVTAACGGEAKLTASSSPPTPVETVPDDLGRPYRRMNLDQLQAAMTQATGGIGWTEVRDGQTIDLFEALSVTLGRPDYLSTTHEDLVPGLLFQKFLEDAARSVCPQWVAEEARRGPSERTLFVYGEPDDPSLLSAHLSAALLRVHGRSVSESSPELQAWTALYEEAARRSSPETAWTAICVALFTHPDFYSI